MNKDNQDFISYKINILESITTLEECNPLIVHDMINQNININLTNKKRKELIRKINIFKAVKLLLTEDLYIDEIAENLSLSSSCIQRYLNNPIIIEELGLDIDEEVKEKLKDNLMKGKRKGGINYSNNNIAIKNKAGQFIGSSSIR